MGSGEREDADAKLLRDFPEHMQACYRETNIGLDFEAFIGIVGFFPTCYHCSNKSGCEQKRIEYNRRDNRIVFV